MQNTQTKALQDIVIKNTIGIFVNDIANVRAFRDQTDKAVWLEGELELLFAEYKGVLAQVGVDVNDLNPSPERRWNNYAYAELENRAHNSRFCFQYV